jgi:hypothetical protein
MKMPLKEIVEIISEDYKTQPKLSEIVKNIMSHPLTRYDYKKITLIELGLLIYGIYFVTRNKPFDFVMKLEKNIVFYLIQIYGHKMVGYQTCEDCEGTGYENCRECNGNGILNGEDFGGEMCDNCDGSGLIDCRECRGDGFTKSNFSIELTPKIVMDLLDEDKIQNLISNEKSFIQKTKYRIILKELESEILISDFDNFENVGGKIMFKRILDKQETIYDLED